MLTPEQRQMRGRIGAYTLHAQGKTNTGPARAAFMSRFEREVDPEGKLSEAERGRRAEAAKRAYFTALALKRSKGQTKVYKCDGCRAALTGDPKETLVSGRPYCGSCSQDPKGAA